MNQSWVDFRTVKNVVSMEMAVAHYGVMLHRLDRCYLRGRCPLPTHVSKNSKQSFIINTEKNAWACHSNSCVAARAGRIGGNVLDFVAGMENCSIREAAMKLEGWFTVTPTHAVPGKHAPFHTEENHPSAPLIQAETNPPLSFALSGIDIHHSYLAERGISLETARHFGIGFYPNRGSMRGRIVIPLHNNEGILVAYAGRSLGQIEPRYMFPARFRKSQMLFNLHRAVLHGKSVVVVEGFFDCLHVHQAGLPCVVALMGCSLSHRQAQLLQAHFQEVTLLLDGDRAGRSAGEAIAARLVSKLSVKLVEIPDGRQPDQLSNDQIRCLCIPDYF
jgi:DNA primase